MVKNKNSQKNSRQEAFNKKLVIFVAIDSLLLAFVTIFFILILNKSAEVQSEVQDISQTIEEKAKNTKDSEDSDNTGEGAAEPQANSTTDIKKTEDGLAVIDNSEKANGISETKPQSTVPTQKPNNTGTSVAPSISEPLVVEQPTATQPVRDINNEYRETLQKKYGIKIAYGDELSSYKPQQKTAVPLKDEVKIRTAMSTLERELAKYPSGFFSEDKNSKLTFYLISKVEDESFAGLTDHELANDVKITLSYDHGFSAFTINHEIMHWIDYMIAIKAYPGNHFTEYTNYNPSNFEYGTTDETTVFYSNAAIPYFVSKYAQTNVLEDRAETFSQIMTRNSDNDMFAQGSVIREKAKIISKQIKKYYKSASGECNWDKLIK